MKEPLCFAALSRGATSVATLKARALSWNYHQYTTDALLNSSLNALCNSSLVKPNYIFSPCVGSVVKVRPRRSPKGPSRLWRRATGWSSSRCTACCRRMPRPSATLRVELFAWTPIAYRTNTDYDCLGASGIARCTAETQKPGFWAWVNMPWAFAHQWTWRIISRGVDWGHSASLLLLHIDTMFYSRWSCSTRNNFAGGNATFVPQTTPIESVFEWSKVINLTCPLR